MGIQVGYIRVSAIDQNTARQDEAFEKEGIKKIFTDKITGATIDRPELNKLRSFVREGDTVVVLSMDRLARNLVEFRNLVEEFVEKGAAVRFLRENLTFTGNDSPMSMLTLSLMGAFAEFERAFIRERQREGIVLAKARGAFKGGVRKLSQEDRAYLYDAVDRGVPKTEVARRLKIQKTTVYSYLKLREALKQAN